MKIKLLLPEHIPAATALYESEYRRLVQSVPALQDDLAHLEKIPTNLLKLADANLILVALEGSRVMGYLGNISAVNFRNTGRTAAYCPVWAHAAESGSKAPVYRALYRAAAAQWTAAGCQVHALSLLASDKEACQVWFWNGFGLAVVDAVRPAAGLDTPAPPAYTVRPAIIEDSPALAAIEAEHVEHYRRPPTLMFARPPNTQAEFNAQLQTPAFRAWGAWIGDELAAYLTLECRSAEVPGLGEKKTAAINGAFTRPQHRGRGLARAVLSAALSELEAEHYTICWVDFESFNPDAAAFWPRFFEPVYFSLLRVPERI